MIRRPPRSTLDRSSAASDVYKRQILRLIPHTSGEVLFDGQNVFDLDGGDLKKMRRDMQIIFQDPYSSLDPRLPVGESISEGLRVHTDKSGQERYDIVAEMLTRVGMRADHARRYPCLFYTSPSPRDRTRSRMPSSA